MKKGLGKTSFYPLDLDQLQGRPINFSRIQQIQKKYANRIQDK
jgi:hypothetical protein